MRCGGEEKETNFICKRARGAVRRKMRVNGQVCRLLFRCDIMDKNYKNDNNDQDDH